MMWLALLLVKKRFFMMRFALPLVKKRFFMMRLALPLVKMWWGGRCRNFRQGRGCDCCEEKGNGTGAVFSRMGAPPLGAFIRAGRTALGSAEDYGKPALMTGYHARGVISPDFCVFWYVLLRDGAAGVLVCGLCRDVMGRYFHFVAWMAAVVLTFAGSCCQLPSSVADGGYIQSNPITI